MHLTPYTNVPSAPGTVPGPLRALDAGSLTVNEGNLRLHVAPSSQQSLP